MFLEHSLNVCESGRAVGIPTNVQLNASFSWLAGLKDVEPGVWIRGCLLFHLQAVTNFLSRIRRKSGRSRLQILVWICECPQGSFISGTVLLRGMMELLEHFPDAKCCFSLDEHRQHPSMAYQSSCRVAVV